MLLVAGGSYSVGQQTQDVAIASRPVFVPVESADLVVEMPFSFTWSSGFAVSQKQKNVDALHQVAREAGVDPVLEVSSRSRESLGSRLSAFHLQVMTDRGSVPVEVAFQASKVYEMDGPFHDLYPMSPRDARRDDRHGTSGALTGFRFQGTEWSLDTGTLFYDSLYLRALEGFDAADELLGYMGFTDIEFNPERSLNCQARSAALFVSLVRHGESTSIASDPAAFAELADRYVASAMRSNRSLPRAKGGRQLDWTI